MAGPEQALTWARRFELVDASSDPEGVRGRFAVELAGPAPALAFLRARSAGVGR